MDFGLDYIKQETKKNLLQNIDTYTTYEEIYLKICSRAKDGQVNAIVYREDFENDTLNKALIALKMDGFIVIDYDDFISIEWGN